MKVFWVLIFAFLLAGCTKPETKPQLASKSSDGRVVHASEQSLWLHECVAELSRTQRNEVRRFNGIGANDVTFLPEVDPVEEIFQKCMSVKPLPSDKASIYKKWLQERILEIQDITIGTTRKELDKILCQNGGFSTPKADIYSHIKCLALKVRIEFELVSDEIVFPFNENDKVKAVSMPYLGLFIIG